ncbi:hypothetical protein FISHEDRAFT_55835 [Fistulina hepatica ATCC 64428]|uniref:hAT-like transposase RNase-H fold domain-containing protein n=1 Tax=Fistulina hepatica ATCC 64428 TaxID=1128425 RepID=A0A0D7AP88_9AGAR|nr:hypothetical protein FISHEDRAFT_55835 [Fistulina hepatica ATCC 64428]
MKEEWDVGAQLCDVLKILKDIILHFSCTNTPNLATVIPAINKINNARWPTEWIKATKQVFEVEFERGYAHAASDSNDSNDEDEHEINIFDDLDIFKTIILSELHSEIKWYLSINLKDVKDVIKWWLKH